MQTTQGGCQLKELVIYLDSKGMIATKTYVQYLSPGEVEGKGMFETMRIVDGNFFCLDEHIARMKRGLELLNIRMPFNKKDLQSRIKALMKRNQLADARVRFSAWKEDGAVHNSVVCYPSIKYSNSKVKKGFSAMVSPVVRNKTRLSHVKSIQYGLFKKALLDARSKGFDEAILLNKEKNVVEGAYTNIFYVKNKALFTPSIGCGCLNGITRNVVIECARRANIKCVMIQEGVKKFLKADEVFITNSAIGVMPLTKINDSIISGGCAGEITLSLRELYNSLQFKGSAMQK
ncbi:MAG: aminotransferase class IV [Candidatus Omnitrophica bacterium]|nr:aminotransferase class IV [Candidatus Omnitrophota bacterium]